jgi:hypothetical protein
MKTVHTIWHLLDGDGPLEGVKTEFGQETLLFELSQDTDDGTYPRLCDWTRDSNRLDEEGPSHWLNRLTRKKNKLKIPFYGGVTIVRDSRWATDAVLEFDQPIEVVMGRIGERLTIEKVKRVKGSFYHDWFWTRNGRQSERANGYEIWFVVESYLE